MVKCESHSVGGWEFDSRQQQFSRRCIRCGETLKFITMQVALENSELLPSAVKNFLATA